MFGSVPLLFNVLLWEDVWHRKGRSQAVLDCLAMLMLHSQVQNRVQTASWVKAFTVTTYQPYFDVDTSDILERIKDYVFPFKGNFNEKTVGSPDLYGPFCICTTLIFISVSIGTTDTFVDMVYLRVVQLCYFCPGHFVYSSYVLFHAFGFCSTTLPLWVLLVCLHWVEILRWVVVGIAGFMSTMFVASNLRNHIVSGVFMNALNKGLQ